MICNIKKKPCTFGIKSYNFLYHVKENHLHEIKDVSIGDSREVNPSLRWPELQNLLGELKDLERGLVEGFR